MCPVQKERHLMSTSTRHGCGRRAASLLAALAWWACAHDADGQLVYDGSIGHAGALAGPNYQINADRGRILGPNLYHSFSSITLAAHESATFSGPASVDNVLARVTGGTPSNIDG